VVIILFSKGNLTWFLLTIIANRVSMGMQRAVSAARAYLPRKKKSMTFTADTNLEVPEIEKRSGQLVDIQGESTIEFWTVMGRSFVTRVVLPK